MTLLTLTVTGAEPVTQQLLRIQAGMKNLTPAFEGMAAEFARIEGEQFRTEGAAGGEKWKALSPWYAWYKEQAFPGKPILQRTGALVTSLTKLPLGIQQIGYREAAFGTDVPYGIYHQTGTRWMPARPPIQLTLAGQMRMAKILHTYLVTGAVI